MKKMLVIVSFFLIVSNLFAKEANEFEGFYVFLSGKYNLIGQKIHSKKTYSGVVILDYKNGKFRVIRKINGKKVVGVGVIKKSIMPESPKYLRVNFKDNGQKYVATYLWHTEYDNYARITGKVNLEGKDGNKAGLEALFAIKK